jgi:hypothetical protein
LFRQYYPVIMVYGKCEEMGVGKRNNREFKL